MDKETVVAPAQNPEVLVATGRPAGTHPQGLPVADTAAAAARDLEVPAARTAEALAARGTAGPGSARIELQQ